MNKTCIILGASAMLLSACHSSPEPEGEKYPDCGIPLSASIKLTQQESLANEGLNLFAHDFYKEAAVQTANIDNGNFAVSPLSASIALAILANTADSNTEGSIIEMMHQPDLETLNSTFNKLISFLPHQSNGARLALANSVWYNKSYTPSPMWSTFMKSVYYADASPVNFGDSSTVDVINGWCNDKTQGLIPRVVDKLDSHTVVMLANAMHFAGSWLFKFDKDKTKSEPFEGRDATMNVEMMHNTIETAYKAGSNYTAVNIPFKGSSSITFVLPTDCTADELSQSINFAELLSPIGFRPCKANVSLPKFEIKLSLDILEILNTLGLPSYSECTKMGINEVCHIGCRQFTSTSIDETGAKIAAVTLIDMCTGTNPTTPEELTFTFNRPFLYFVINSYTNTVLMAGRVNGI